MLGTLETMGALMGEPAELLGCLVTHWESDASSTDTYVRLAELFNNRKSRILQTKIPMDATIEKTAGQSHHRAVNAYAEALEEVLAYVNGN